MLAAMQLLPATAGAPVAEIRIVAAQPGPASGPEWVMLENHVDGAANKPFKTFLPIVTRPNNGEKPGNDTGLPPALDFVDISGWQLGNAGVWYTLPHDLPPMPAGARVIVFYDGLGAAQDDYSYSDGAARLHTPAGLVDALPDRHGAILLYAGDVNTPENLRAKYEWGNGISDLRLWILD